MRIISTKPENYRNAYQIPVSAFSRDGKHFSADASILEHRGYHFTGQLYDDAADQGFLLVNPTTGNAVPFVLDKVDKIDGDVVGWRFKPDSYSFSKTQTVRELTVLVVNT